MNAQLSHLTDFVFPLTPGDVQVTLHNGRVLDSRLVHANGGSERPMPEADIITNFEEFAGPALGAARATAIRDVLLGLADGSSCQADLCAHLYDPIESCFIRDLP